MGKRAQPKRAAKHAKQAKQRTAAASRNAATFTAVAANLPRLTSMDDILFRPLATPWGDFTDTYATVDDALSAAEEAGGVLSCFSFDDSGEYERSLRHGADGWTYEVALYPRGTLRHLVKTSWLDADDQDQAVEQLHRALAVYVPETLRHSELQTVQRPSTTSVPRIGWAQSLPMAGMQTWEDVRLAEKDLPLFALAPFADGPGRSYGPLPEETFALFRAHGLNARNCAGCGAPVTDRHPHWPGVLVSVENEYGPVCDRSRLDGESVQRVGHVLDAAQARPAGKLTGKEQKVQCQHCAVHVTEQHPDWPSVWTEAGGYSRPICAVVGSGCSDDLSYDLVDCVYPHVPVGADEGPAAAAITAAKKGCYFFQVRLPSFLEG
ncbi:hypothetical protein [Streptomyces sp. NPDC058294]|uniref:hypothetical protein n=1 Tax=Streptomyces sp. NPDC058294 TaxID=3346430 RepID=UPI0036EBEB06